MRVLILCEGDAETWDSWSGISHSVVAQLRAAGHEVTCGDVELYGAARYITGARTFARDRRRWAVRFRLGATGFEARSARAQRIVDRFADAVDVVMQFGATFGVRLPPGLPLVLYCDSNFEYSRDGAASGHSEAAALGEAEAAGVRTREAAIYASAARIFTLSERLRRVFIERFGVPPDRVETVYAGPNIELGAPAGPAPARTPSEPVVLFVGRAFERKGGPELLAAFARVRACMPEARLVVIGPDALPEEGAADGVELLGFVDKSTAEGREALRTAYARARVFCLPTQFEAFGIVYLEAMSNAVPCIGPDRWAVPEIIEHGVTGLLVPPGDPVALANAMLELLRDPARARAMGEAGKTRLEERFTWPAVVARMTGAMSRVLQHQGAVPGAR